MKAPVSFRSARLAIALVIGVLSAGVAGLMWLERLSFADALYVTVSLMTTVGDMTFPLSPEGRMYAIGIMVLGIGSLLYTFGVVMEYVIEGHLGLAVRRRLMENRITSLRGHFVICGFGRVGSQIAEDLRKAGRPFIVVDEKDALVQECVRLGYLTVQGDATSDDVLLKAGVQRAHGLLVATENDSHNISITLSARHLSAALFIVARSNHDETAVKLKLAGADMVLSPYTIAGHRMANLALQPDTAETALPIET